MEDFIMIKNRLNIRINDEDKDIIVNYCKKHGINISNFVRYCALEKAREDLEKNKEENK